MTESCVFMYTKVKRDISIHTHAIFSQACMHVIHGLLSVELVLQFFSAAC